MRAPRSDRGALLTPDELRLIADATFFPAKARIMAKVRGMLEGVHEALKPEAAGAALLTPEGFDPAKYQLVKGEHLEDFPYQYLDFPKHFVGDDKFTFRSLFWWGHGFVFALLLEGTHLPQYKRHLINRFHQVAGRGLCLSLAPTLWEWKEGEGYTLPLTHDRKPEASAVLSGRRAVKLARYLRPDDPLVADGALPTVARETFRSLLPVIAP